MKIQIWDIENHHIILSKDEIWVISFFLWNYQFTNHENNKVKFKFIYIYIEK